MSDGQAPDDFCYRIKVIQKVEQLFGLMRGKPPRQKPPRMQTLVTSAPEEPLPARQTRPLEFSPLMGGDGGKINVRGRGRMKWMGVFM